MRFGQAALGVGLGTCALVAGGTGCSPGLGSESQTATPSMSLGGDAGISRRVLVGYATHTGSTVGVAEAIGQELAERGMAVDVKPFGEQPSLAGYGAVVLGGAVDGGAWLDEAVDFVHANRAKLAQVPVAAFCVHIMNAGTGGKETSRRMAYLDDVRENVTLIDEGYFLGKGPAAYDASFIARWAFRLLGGSGEGDCRDWAKIRAWADQVAV